jgi:hypothetical protein
MTILVNSSLQIEVPPPDANTEQMHAVMANIGAAATKNSSIWIKEVPLSQPLLFEEALEKSLLTVRNIVAMPEWPSGVSISIWMRVSSPNEFTGLVVSADIASQAAALNVDLVISVYGSQAERIPP